MAPSSKNQEIGDVVEVELSNSRRQYPRVDVQHEFSTCVANRALNLTSANLSFGGAFLKTDVRFNLGTLINLSLEDSDAVAETQAKVVHQNSHGIAVSFYEPAEGFLHLLCKVLYRQILENVSHGVPEDEVPARVALLSQQQRGYHVLFTSSLNPNGALVLVEDATIFGETLWLTLCERGLFDCKAQVTWREPNMLRLKFIDPSAEFMAAHMRIYESFLG